MDRERDVTLCDRQPSNMGICCTEHGRCESCGWNPEVDAARKREIKRAIDNGTFDRRWRIDDHKRYR